MKIFDTILRPMTETIDFPLQEAVGRDSNLTPQQEKRLEALDVWVDEMILTMEEGKEYGVWQAHYRHIERTEHPNMTRL